MQIRFTDRVAIVTGGAAGMGRAAALGFAREGAAVVVNDIDEAGLRSLAGEIEALGGRIAAGPGARKAGSPGGRIALAPGARNAGSPDARIALVPGDITDPATARRLVERAETEFGRADILFNYAGGDPDLAPQTPFVDQDESFWERMVAMNLTSTLRTCRAVLPGMTARGWGRIVNTGAIAGKIGGPNMALYSAVKGGVIAFTKALALEAAPHGVTVNCVCPGPIATPGLTRVFADQVPEEIVSIVPLHRVGTPEEVASAVLYLASDEAGFITGQAVSVDGGATRI